MGQPILVFDHNTIIHTNSSVLYAYGAAMPGCVYTNNMSQHHTLRHHGRRGEHRESRRSRGTSPAASSSATCWRAAAHRSIRRQMHSRRWRSGMQRSSIRRRRLPCRARQRRSRHAGCNGTVPGADLAALGAAMAGDVGEEPPTAAQVNQAPIADAGGPYIGGSGRVDVRRRHGSRDPDGAVLDYLWSWGDEVLVRAADLPSAAIRGTEWKKSAISDARRRSDAPQSGQGRGKARSSPRIARELHRVHGQCGSRRAVPALAAQPCDRQLLYTTIRSTCSSAAQSTQLGRAVARIGTTSALSLSSSKSSVMHGSPNWGWSDAGYGADAPPVYFAQTGPQTIRCSSARTASAGIN